MALKRLVAPALRHPPLSSSLCRCWVILVAAVFGWCCCTIVVVQAVAPPHPDYVAHPETPYESLRAYRKRLNITAYDNYTPQHISPQHCRFLTKKECMRDDEAARARIAQGRRNLQGGSNLVTQGTVTILVLLCRFKDHENKVLPERSYYDQLFNGGDVNPVGGLSEWLFANSGGKYQVTFDVQDWVTTTETEAFYAANNYGLNGADQMQEMFKPLMDSLFSSGYNFLDLDSTGWGTLDGLVVVHSGAPAEAGLGDCVAPPEQRIWSQGVFASANGWFSSDFSYSVSNYLLVGATTEPACTDAALELGVPAHEFMHLFGLIDLYDLDDAEEPIDLGGTGRFGIMSNPLGWNRDMMVPGMLQPYSRVFVGWLTPVEIITDGYYPIQPSEISSQVYVIRKNFPDGEYLYIENKQPMLWDSNFEASGLVIYKVDDNADKQKNRGYPGHPNWPNEHYRVHVLQADGKTDIEQGNNVGDAGDFWTKGMTLTSGGDWPNTNSMSNGLQPTGITINIITDSSFVVVFQVTGLN